MPGKHIFIYKFCFFLKIKHFFFAEMLRLLVSVFLPFRIKKEKW